jgi:hypothetical protein
MNRTKWRRTNWQIRKLPSNINANEMEGTSKAASAYEPLEEEEQHNLRTTSRMRRRPSSPSSTNSSTTTTATFPWLFLSLTLLLLCNKFAPGDCYGACKGCIPPCVCPGQKGEQVIK